MTDRLTDAELDEITSAQEHCVRHGNIGRLDDDAIEKLLKEIRRLRAIEKVTRALVDDGGTWVRTSAIRAALDAARAERLPKEVLVLVSRLRYLTANWGAEGDETAALAGTQAADLLVSLSAQVEATNARAEKAEKVAMDAKLALLPFVVSYLKRLDHVAVADLYNEQPWQVEIELGTCRRAHGVFDFRLPPKIEGIDHD